MSIATANIAIGTVSENTSAGTTLNVAYPTSRNIRSDDVLYLMFSTATLAVPSDVSGFTVLGKLSSTGNTALPGIWAGYKKAAGGETGNVAVATANGVSWGQILAMPDIDLSVFIDVAATTKDQSTAQTTITSTAITTVTDGALLVCGSADNATGHNASIDSGYTETGDRVAGTRVAQLAYLLKAVAGSSQPIVTWTGSGRGIQVLSAFRAGPPRAGHFFG